MKTLKRSPGLLWLMSCYQWHMSLERWFILSKAAATENLQQTKNKQGSKGFFFKIICHKDQKGWKCKFVGYTWLVTPDDGTHPWRVIFWWHALTVWCVLSLCSVLSLRQGDNVTMQCDSVTTTCATHGGGDLLMTVNLREYKIPVSTSASHLNIDQGIPWSNALYSLRLHYKGREIGGKSKLPFLVFF